jgi:hypothetical protein
MNHFVACLCVGGAGFALFPTFEAAHQYLVDEYGDDLVVHPVRYSANTEDGKEYKYRVAGFTQDFIITMVSTSGIVSHN